MPILKASKKTTSLPIKTVPPQCSQIYPLLPSLLAPGKVNSCISPDVFRYRFVSLLLVQNETNKFRPYKIVIQSFILAVSVFKHLTNASKCIK